MKKIIASEKFNMIWSLCALMVMWCVWLIVAACVKNAYLVPSFEESAKEFFTLTVKGFFWKAFLFTLLRTLIAFLVSFVLAAGCACLAAAVKGFAAFMRPVAAICRSLPTMAVLLLILVWLTPRTAPVAVCFLVLFPMIYSQLHSGICGIDKNLIEMAEVYKLSAKKKLTYIYLPHIAPQTVENTGINISFGIKLTVSAEVMASTFTAIGGLMSEAQMYINLPRLAALTLWAVVAGIISEWTFRIIARRAFKWKRGERL